MQTLNQRESLNLAKTLSVMLTHQCPAECSDCGTFSGPKVKEHISGETAMRYISEAAQNGFAVVVFTGGEATLRWDDLLSCIAHARNLKLPTRLVTNAHWATSLSMATKKVEALISAGLNEINFSTGDEHARFIPLKRVALAAVAAVRSHITTCVMIEARKDRDITREKFLSVCEEFALTDAETKLLGILESAWMPVDPNRIAEYKDNSAINRENAPFQNTCDSILTTYTIQANGQVGSCCGIGMRIVPELAVGDINTPLATLIERGESDFMKLMLRYIGPHRLLSWAAAKDPSIEWENMYAHHCQTCLRLYDDPRVSTIIRKHHRELQDEVIDAIALEKKYHKIFLQKNQAGLVAAQQTSQAVEA